MAQVSVRINGRDYTLACDDGQEEQLVALGQEVDDRVRQISRQAPHAGEVMLFLLSAIMLADELSDTRRQARQIQARLNRLEERLENPETQSAAARLSETEAAMAETLKEVASRIEKIAQQLEME